MKSFCTLSVLLLALTGCGASAEVPRPPGESSDPGPGSGQGGGSNFGVPSGGYGGGTAKGNPDPSFTTPGTDPGLTNPGETPKVVDPGVGSGFVEGNPNGPTPQIPPGAGAGDDEVLPPDPIFVQMRLAHLVPQGETVVACVTQGGKTTEHIAEGVSFRDLSSYFEVNVAEQFAVEIYPPSTEAGACGAAGRRIARQVYMPGDFGNVSGSERFTLFLSGALPGSLGASEGMQPTVCESGPDGLVAACPKPSLRVSKDVEWPGAEGRSRIRIVNGMVDSWNLPVDVCLDTDGSGSERAFTEVSPKPLDLGEASPYMEFPLGVQDTGGFFSVFSGDHDCAGSTGQGGADPIVVSDARDGGPAVYAFNPKVQQMSSLAGAALTSGKSYTWMLSGVSAQAFANDPNAKLVWKLIED